MADEYVKVCKIEELDEDRTKLYSVDGCEMLLIRQGNIVFAMENVCSHEQFSIGTGEVLDGELTCPRHGARFDITNGRAVSLPAVMGLKSYPVKVVDGSVLVSPGYGRVS